MSAPEVFIAVPVFRGAEVIAETLRSIRNQTFANFRVLISVDDNDAESAEACRPFMSDSRISLALKSRRLGWAGNLNWLIQQCDCPFFCYWQQDDLTATNYLEVLRSELLTHADAAIAYADVQWFGARFERESAPSLLGTPAARVLQLIEVIRFEPLRGLMRAEFIPRHEAIPVSADESCHTEFTFLARMAARGSLRRVTNTLYFKRAHSQNTFARWNDWPEYRRRRCWIDMGLGLFDVARETLSDSRGERRLLATILDRLTVPRPGRLFFYQPDAGSPSELARFARDFLVRGGLAVPTNNTRRADGDSAAFCRPILPDIDAALAAQSQAAAARRSIAARLTRDRDLQVAIRMGGDGLPLLGSGWSRDEPWGVWSDGDEAELWLPHGGHGPWRVSLIGHHFAGPRRNPDKRVRVEWRIGADAEFRTHAFQPGAETCLDIEIDELTSEARQRLQLRFPDAVFLPDEGINDSRQVGFGLRQVRISRLDERGVIDPGHAEAA